MSRRKEPDRRPHRQVGDHPRPRSARPGNLRIQAVLRRFHHLRGGAEQPGQPGRCRVPRHAAGHQQALRRAGGAHRPRPQGGDQPQVGVRPEELFLRRPARRLSDLAVHPADRRQGHHHARPAGGREAPCRHHAPAPGAGRRQEPARPASDQELHRSQPLRHCADGDRVGARHALVGRGCRVLEEAALDPALSRHLRRQHGGRLHALRRQRLGAQARRRARHALRDQERELDPLRPAGDRIRGAAPDRDHRGRRRHQAGDAALRPQQGRDPLHALQGARARLPLLPRPGPAAAGARSEVGERDQGDPAGAAGREARALHQGLRPQRL